MGKNLRHTFRWESEHAKNGYGCLHEVMSTKPVHVIGQHRSTLEPRQTWSPDILTTKISEYIKTQRRFLV
jgi:hypothetical protein